VPKNIVFIAASAAPVFAIFEKSSVLALAWIAALEIVFTEFSPGFACWLFHKRLRSSKFNRARASAFVQEMMDNVRSYLRITQARPNLVKNYFRERHVQYAAT